MGGKEVDMTEVIVENYHKNHLDALICLGGGGTQKNALHLAKAGLQVLTLPKTIDNDVAMTDVTFGFDTAVDIATQAISGAHNEAEAYPNGIGLVKLMGRHSGFLAATAALAQQGHHQSL